ncbi:unnamed protein product [Sphagnum balticum]
MGMMKKDAGEKKLKRKMVGKKKMVVEEKGKNRKKYSFLPSRSTSGVLYIGHIPHGFYEDQMRGFFGQFGTIKRLRLSRNKKTGKSKHYAFIEFETPEVAQIVAEAMHNYLLFESMLQVKLVPLEKIHSRFWIGANQKFKTVPWQQLERQHHNRVRTPEEQRLLLEALVKKDQKRRSKILSVGIDYDYPEIRALIPPSSKRITHFEL